MKLAPINSEQLISFNIEHKLLNLWQHVNNLINAEKLRSGLDANAESAVVLWMATGQLTEKRKAMLEKIELWSREAWQTYWALRLIVETGTDVELPESLTPCPYTFRDLLFSEAV